MSTATPDRRRVVVTGIGVLSPYGLGRDAFFAGLRDGRSAVEPLPPPYDRLLPGYGGRVTAEWKDLRGLPGAKGHRPATMTRYTYLACGAIGTALQDAGIDPEAGDPQRRGLFTGSYCNMDSMDKYIRFSAVVADRTLFGDRRFRIDDARVMIAMKKFTGFDYLKLMNNMPTAHGGIQANCQGPCNTFLGHAAAGAQAIGRAARAVQDGLADVMVAGGVGSSVHEHLMMVKGHRHQLASSEAEPARASRPFDRGATGQVPGEAGAYLVLEELGHARARGARIYAELLGFSDLYTPPASRHGVPSKDGAAAAAREALAEAGLSPRDLDILVATGLSRPDLDAVEAEEVADVLGDAAPGVAWTAVSAFLGFPEAATAPLGAAAALMAMESGVVPGTPNTPDPIPGWLPSGHPEARERRVRAAWVNAVSPEGGCASLVFGAADR